MANILDMMKQEEQKSNFAERMSDIFRVTESSRVRFLTDFSQGVGLYWHKNFDEQVDHPCYKQFGQDCAFCYADEKKTKRNAPVYAFAVYDYDKDKVLILHGRDHEKTIVGKVKSYWLKKKSLLGRDFFVDRSGERMTTSYSVAPDDPSSFEFADKFAGLTADIDKLQEVLKRTLVLSFDPAFAESLEYNAETDKLSSFLAASKRPANRPVARQVVRRPVQSAPQEDDIHFDDED